MTEDEWLAEVSPYLMLQHLHQHHNVARMPGGQRLLRLFRCAGCDNEELLAHCRDEGPHARGCWAIDMILRK
jgi:hypothetical protein